MILSSEHYDVFLCYNSREKEAVLWLEKRLTAERFRTFLDDRALVVGGSLSADIPKALTESRACAVLLGPSGISNYQSFEIDVAVHRAIQDPAYRIIVVMLPGADAVEIPPSLRHRLHVNFSAGLDDSGAFRSLIAGIRGSLSDAHDSDEISISPPYRSMAPRSDSFVQRPELEAIVEALTRTPIAKDHLPTAVALTTALRGAGGFGKTALAQAVCEHEKVRQHFPAGILWITLGQRLSEAQRLVRVRDLLRWWTRKEPPLYETLEPAAGFLRESLSGQRALLVLDDVWLAADVAPFAGIAAPAALLITTRNTRALPTAVYTVVVDALELPRAVELLSQGLSPLPPLPKLERLAQRLGEWPILLKLVNAQLREEYRDGVAAIEAFRVVEETLDELGLTAFDRENEEARNLAVRRTVEASLQRLSFEDRERYARLAVFPEDERIPLAVLQLLWKVEGQEVARVCRQLAEMSLLYRFDPVSRWIQLHDVLRAYLLREHRNEVQSFQGTLVDSFLTIRQSGADTREAESHQYFVARFPYHLKESGREQELEELLFSYPWLKEKVSTTDVNAAMADYDLLEGDQESESVREALLLSRSVLTQDITQLQSHLHGRLLGSHSARIAGLLEGALVNQTRPWFRPLAATLRRPDDPLVYSLQDHQGEILTIAQLDEHRFATAGTDGKIHIWDFTLGELVTTINAANGAIRHLVTIAQNRLLAASIRDRLSRWLEPCAFR